MTESTQSSPTLSPLKRAFLAIGELQAKLAAAESAAREPIAVVGMGCRFPGGVETPAQFWNLLRDGRDAVSEVPPSRWPVDAFFDDDPAMPGRMTARHGGFLAEIDRFDAAFFGISPREAASMDPQQRLLLEVAREALTASGQWRERLAANPMGVFVGITTTEFGQLQLAAEGIGALDAYHITGTSLNAAAGRLAFVFGLHGPCMAVDTACSSALVALHLAIQSLRAGECETALAGGVNLILSPLGSIALTKGGVLSSDGRSKTFDAAADGMVRGEGCGLLVLKKLSAAQRDGDRVLAVLRESGVNQDGPSSGLTVPNGPAQEALLRRVLETARVEPAAVDYIEAHGTGTALGDPIEVGALSAVYGAGRANGRPLWIGSVKTNLGHLESAAGIASVIKVVLALQHEAIPPHLHFTHPSPHIDWAHLPVRVPTSVQAWPRGERPRFAAVSAFGFSGTNAHVLIEEAPAALAGAANDPRGWVASPVAFKREHFPLPRPANYGGMPAADGAHPLLGRELALAGSTERRFEAQLAATAPGWLADHRIFETAVVPAAAWLEIAQAAGRAVLGERVTVTDFVIEQALAIGAADTRTVQTVVGAGEDRRPVDIFAQSESGWTRHAKAVVTRDAARVATTESLRDVRRRCGTALDVATMYAAYAAHGLSYGPAFRAVKALWRGENEVVAELELPEGTPAGFDLHPALIDACFQAAGMASGASNDVFLPVGAARWAGQRRSGAHVWCHARVEAAAPGVAVTATWFSEEGEVLAELDKLVLQRAPAEALRRIAPRRDEGVYQIEWPAVSASLSKPALAGDWLVIGDREGVSTRLREAGANVGSIEPAALEETLTRGGAWRGIVHLGALAVAVDAAPTYADLGLDALLTLTRVNLKTEGVWIVTRGAVAAGEGAVSPAAAAVVGLGRVLIQEHPEWALRLVDVDDFNVAEAIARECATNDDENQVAWRRGVRHAARLAPYEFAALKSLSVRADATYLITGGLGALGLVTASWLVGRGARHLVLAGRHEPGENARAQIAAWSDAGVRVETRIVDIAERGQVAALLAALPALRGIVHAAGTIADGSARQLSPEQFARVLAPKAHGARHLDELAGELDFFVLFSSAASVLGTPGQANYAAANGYLDGLAQARRSAGRTATTINWGGWSVGLAAGSGARYAERGIRPITPARGGKELGRLLDVSATQAVVLPVRWKTFLAALPGGRVPPLLSKLVTGEKPHAPASAAEDFRARLATAPDAVAAAELINDFVRGEIAGVLRLAPEKLSPEQPLNALGLDSIMAVDIRNRLRLATGIDVPVVALLEGGSVTSVAAAMSREAHFGEKADGQAVVPTLRRDAPLSPAPTEQPLSTGQEALWFLHRAAPESAAYNTAVALRLRGKLDRAKLRGVLETLQARHPLLRATFADNGDRPVMRIQPEPALAWREVDAGTWDAAQLSREVAADYQRPFALEHGPVFRATLFTAGDGDHVLLLGVHHIVGDAWTNWVLLDEFRQLYAEAAPLASVSGTYADFVRWQRELLAGAEGERLWSWWRQELSGELPVLALPLDYPRPAVLVPQGASEPLALSAGCWLRLKELARAQQTTPFAVLLAAYLVFLHRHTGQDDIIVGSPTSGRSRAEFAGVAGYFVNPVPLRARVVADATFTDFLAGVKQTVLGALAHADFPLPRLVEGLKLPRDPSRPALFQTLFVFQKPPQTDARGDALKSGGERTGASWGGMAVEEFPLAQMEGQFELTLELFEDGDGSFKYNTALFAPETVARMARRFELLLDAITAAPAKRIDELPLIGADERQLVVETWNHTPADYPQQHCLHELIAQQAARTPDAPAVCYDAETLSYRELDRRANQLALWLRQAGVGPDQLVGVCAERSLELVVALLGVLKAGGAYVPLDPGYPRERLAFMIGDSAVALVLTQERMRAELQTAIAGASSDREKGPRAISPRIVALDTEWPDIDRAVAMAPANNVTPGHLAYMIYTSGSTGRPKGALNTHGAIVNRLLWMQDVYRLTAANTVVQKTPFSFDVSVWEFFWPLLAGARLLVAKPGGHQDPAYLADLVARERVTTMHFVPSMLQVFVEQPGIERCTALRQVFCSGEALAWELQERFFARHGAELHNLYGPTEAAVDVSFWRCERNRPDRVVPIGRPIARTQLYVLDARLQPVPVGVAGELYIGGVSLARGYLGRPELTAEKFMPDPFGPPGARLYRTGDCARWRSDGTIEYLGRLDHQVKLRGFRIELGEIEAALRRHPAVSEAVVVVREDQPGEKALAAYVVGVADESLVVAELRRVLRESLPEYMVPADFVVLPSLPLTPNGKLDRRALPAPPRGGTEPSARYRAPESPTEQLVAALWGEVLGRGRIGVEDNFFDLGGHSLKLGQVHARLVSRFPQPPPLLELFQYPTIRALARRLDGQGKKQPAPAATDSQPQHVRAPDATSPRDPWADQRALRRAARAGGSVR